MDEETNIMMSMVVVMVGDGWEEDEILNGAMQISITL
jgi:hypothetical protein